MPTKAKADTEPKIGFFERCGRYIDRWCSWIGRCVSRIRTTYTDLNTDYIKTIRSHKIGKLLPPSLILLSLLFIFLPILASQVINNEEVLYASFSETGFVPMEPLYDGTVTQNFSGYDTQLSSVSVLIGTHRRRNDASYVFSIAQGQEVLYSEVFSPVLMEDNTYQKFKFPVIQLEEDVEYSFSIKALDTNDSNAISIYADRETGELAYRLDNRSSFYYFVIIISCTFLVIFCVINFLINSGKVKTEYHFLAYALLYIVPSVFIYPAYTVPDEPYHFLSTMRLAEYDVSKPLVDNLSHREVNLPSNSQCLSDYYLYNTARVDVAELDRCFKAAPSERGEYIDADRSNRLFAYAPAVLGIKFGDLISDSPMVIFYCGRVFNLLAVSVILVYTISLVKKHRMILLAIIMIPMFLQQAISYSYDGLLNAFCLLVIAYGIHFLTTDASVRKRDIIILALSLAFIGFVKIPYILVATPLLFVKTEQYGRRKWVKWLILAGLLCMAVVPYLLDSCLVPPDPNAITSQGRGLPLSNLLRAPRASLHMFLRTLENLGGFYLTSMIGYFGWFYFALNPIIICADLVFLVLVVLSSTETKFTKAMRYLAILAAFAIIGGTFLAMYLSHTTPGSPVIEGVQGRYFLPALMLIMLALIPQKQCLDLRATTCYAFFNLILLCYIITLLVGFF